MPPYTAAQKQTIQQFVALTDTKDSVAAKFLKGVSWSLERAVDAFYSNTAHANQQSSRQSVGHIFDEYRGTISNPIDISSYTDFNPENPADSPDTVGIEGAMKYLGDIDVQLDEVTCLGIMELCKCPAMGEFNREGFLTGWREAGCDTTTKMSSYAATLRAKIPTDAELFRRVYRYSFPISRMQGQRNLQFDLAAEQWRLFFTADRGGVPWNTESTPWLDWWLEFLEGRGKKPVNKDLWEQVEVFMRKTREDEAFGWWSADGAWPGALDDFVAFVQGKRGKGSEMELS
ncbi:Cullin binding-domain-containing protein [Penicillium canariense]|uniref:Defective in cullin neddylation protein n=1 Tax=Penicillium canariense TaxID=189055 RepID=A0A9W9HVB1_9EURO|nr:Cullin binding-domain-containing protein [Penicillium canariense]KAJ5159607.1 Cullin binding-domain-containing protein [Penicillium canariense]